MLKNIPGDEAEDGPDDGGEDSESSLFDIEYRH